MTIAKKLARIVVAVLVICLAAMPADARKKAPKAPKYVFYMIGDGMGVNEVFGTQIFNQATGKGPAQINFAHFPYRSFVTTFSASSLVTDSAAGGTALATGVKTYNDGLGVDANGNPVSSIAEWAHAAGFGAGVATSVGVNHATPAAFYGHVKARSEYEKLAEQLIDTDAIDFAAGAGFLNEARKTGHDSQYLEQKAKDAGIAVLHGKSQFKNLGKLKKRAFCFSADPKETELKYAIDRRSEDDTKLGDFVEAGIEYLYGHFAKKGFFFMIEGGKIDYAGHNDDGAADFMELNDFASVVDIVLAFYDKHPDETLIVITADHETGALMLGSGQYEMHADRLSTQSYSENVLNTMFRELSEHNVPSWDQVKSFLKQNIGLWGTIPVNERQEAVFKEMYDRQFGSHENDQVSTLYSSSTRIVSDALDYANKQAGYNWAHGSHTGSPVGLYVKGATAEKFMSCEDNTDIPKMIKALAGY